MVQLEGKGSDSNRQDNTNIIKGASGEARPPPPSGSYVSETHSQQIKMSWTATTLTGMEGTDIRHIKRMNHPTASCSRQGAADHKHETWCKQCFGRHLSRGSRGWTLCKTPRRRQRWAQREKRLHPWTFSADPPCIDVLTSLCGAWALVAKTINSVKATNSRAIDGSPNDWEDKQMHSRTAHKMAALYLKPLFSQQLGNNYRHNARNHIACVSQFQTFIYIKKNFMAKSLSILSNIVAILTSF